MPEYETAAQTQKIKPFEKTILQQGIVFLFQKLFLDKVKCLLT
jgi:hypothetical protein